MEDFEPTSPIDTDSTEQEPGRIPGKQQDLRGALSAMRRDADIPATQQKLCDLANLSRRALSFPYYRFAIKDLNEIKKARKQAKLAQHEEKRKQRRSMVERALGVDADGQLAELRRKLDAQRARAYQYWQENQALQAENKEWERKYNAMLDAKRKVERQRDEAYRRLDELLKSPTTGEVGSQGQIYPDNVTAFRRAAKTDREGVDIDRE